MLTHGMLKQMPPGTIFATGRATIKDSLVANEYAKVNWVAVRGGIDDWAIYYSDSQGNKAWPNERIAKWGQKVHNNSLIRRLVRCTNKAFNHYNH